MKKIFTLLLILVSVSAMAETKTETASETKTKIKIEKPTFSGYVQGMYTYSDDASTFSIKRVRMSVKGTLTDKFFYVVQAELSTSSNNIVDAVVGYTPMKEVNIKLGQYKIPFSLENTDSSPTSMEFINYPLGLRLLQGNNSLTSSASSFADIGITAYGSAFHKDGYSVLSYDLGVFNGQGGNTTDANKSKDIAARVRVQPIKGLTLTGSYYYGEKDAEYLSCSIYSAGIQYKAGNWVVRSEYFGGKRQYVAGYDATPANSVYGLIGYNVTSKISVAARGDYYSATQVSASETASQTNYTVGVSYKPIKYVRLMLNYTYETYNASAGIDNGNSLMVSVFGMF